MWNITWFVGRTHSNDRQTDTSSFPAVAEIGRDKQRDKETDRHTQSYEYIKRERRQQKLEPPRKLLKTHFSKSEELNKERDTQRKRHKDR